MLIKVTQDDINTGIKNSYHCCPVSRAVKRQTNSQLVFTTYRKIILSKDCKKLVFSASRSVQRFIKKFDDGKPVKPFNFKLQHEVEEYP